MNYDIIGDIHGCDQSLTALLEELDYVRDGGCYRHPSRQAIFLGDFVDRGPGQREVLGIVRPMIDGGAALSVMGNHEFNAIAYATPRDGGGYLRGHSDKHRGQHRAFLDAYDGSDEYLETIEWMKGLPLWLELDGLRVVHAGWDAGLIARLEQEHRGSRLDEALLRAASTKGEWEYDAIETLLKGKEIRLPEGSGFPDKDGNVRHEIRVRWWSPTPRTYREAYMGPEDALAHIPAAEISGERWVGYGDGEPPVFVGHYWHSGRPDVLAANVACLDYSVAKPGGKLVAYRWDGEQVLSADKFVSVERREPTDPARVASA